MVGLGGGSVDPLLPAQIESAFGCIATVGYGSTELGGPALMARAGDAQPIRWRSVGRPLPGVEVRIGDAPMEGSLEVRSPARALGYVRDDHFEAFDSEWLLTGDLAHADADGNVTILGRADALIVRGGRNVDPTSIEQRIAQHDDVVDVAVVGVPSRVSGETDVAALIVPADPACPPSLSEIRSWLARSPSTVPSIQVLQSTSAIPRVRDGGPDLIRCRAAVDPRSRSIPSPTMD